MSEKENTYVPVDWLSKARVAEADENTFEARKAYQRVAEQDPQNTEAAFFLSVYDALETPNNEVAEQCGIVEEKLGAAADALRSDPEAAARFAPMAKRSVGLAKRCIRVANFVRDHYLSTNRQDLQIADRRRDSWCASAIGLLERTETCAAAIPGAEEDLLTVRRESLDALSTHGAGIPERERQTRMQRLRAEIRKADPTADTGVPMTSHLARLKLPAMIGLFVLSLAAMIARAYLCKDLMIGSAPGVMAVVFAGVLLALFFWAIRARDMRMEGYGARMCAGIYFGVQAAFLAMSALSGGFPSPLRRGLAMPVDTLVVGLLLIYYVFRSSFKANWGSALMCAIAVGFLAFGLTASPTDEYYDKNFRAMDRQREIYSSVLLSPEQAKAAESETEDTSDPAAFLTLEQIRVINDGVKAGYEEPGSLLLAEDGKYSVRRLVLSLKTIGEVLENREEQTSLDRKNYLLATIGVFLSDLGCAVGFLNFETGADKKKKRAA